MPRKTQILFLTNSEYGQANVLLAVAQELLLRENCGVHFASFSPLAKRVEELRDGEFGSYPTDTSCVTFHLLSGPSMHEARMQKWGIPSLIHAPGTKGAVVTYEKCALLASTRNGSEYLQNFHDIEEVVKAVTADIIVIDEYFFVGMDVCIKLSKEYLIMGPSTFREHASDLESLWVKMSRYPARASGFSYPLRRRKVPVNLYLNFRMIKKFLTTKHPQSMLEARKKAGLDYSYPARASYQKGITYILPVTPESDFPCPVPQNIVSCGPIILPSAPLSTIDPELDNWLDKLPTVLVNLGTFLKPSQNHARELATGIRLYLEHNHRTQILWKLRTDDDSIFETATKILQEHIQTGRAKVEAWLKAPPSEIVKRVICSVHHGGASSYFEAIGAGVPHIVLPPWWDCYEFAARVEYLGIGIYGSRKSKTAPECDASELAEALKTLTDEDNAEGKQMRERAKKLAETCNTYGGRATAANKILECAAMNMKKVEAVGKTQENMVEKSTTGGPTEINHEILKEDVKEGLKVSPAEAELGSSNEEAAQMTNGVPRTARKTNMEPSTPKVTPAEIAHEIAAEL